MGTMMLLDTLPVWEEELITMEEDIILLLVEVVRQVEKGEVEEGARGSAA